MSNWRLPRVPNDVLAALELLPRAAIEDINIKILIFGGLEVLKKPIKPLTKKRLRNHLVSTDLERTRLIWLSVEELGLKAEVDALCASCSDEMSR